MAERPMTRTGRAGRAPSRTARLADPGRFERLREALGRPGIAPSALIFLSLAIAGALVIGLSRGRLLPAEGRIADESRTARVDFEIEDEARTERARAERSLLMPRVYRADQGALREIEASLRSLPAAAAAAEDFSDVAPEILQGFALTPEQFQALRAIGQGESSRAQWDRRVDALIRALADQPVLSSEEIQLALNDPAPQMDLVLPNGETRRVAKTSAVSAAADNSAVFRARAVAAGFAEPSAGVITARFTLDPRPLFIFDKAETDARRARAAAEVPPAMVRYRVGEVLVRRGEVVKPEQSLLIRLEDDRFQAGLPTNARLAQWVGVALVAFVISAVFALYVRLFDRALIRAPGRLIGLALLLVGGTAVACWATIGQPGWIWATATAPLVLTIMLTAVAFEPRMGLAAAAAQCAIVGAALSLPLGFLAAILFATALAAWSSRDIRSRGDVVRATIIVSAGLGLAAVAVGLLTRPLVAHGFELRLEILGDGLRATLSAFLVGALSLVFLPAVERLFDFTTGMTLSEWRDPKQPLLRKLQLQAPGTFNHSHTVATLAEAAAEAIGANGLHVYLGALYHDIGKMNKPDYFVENQPRGFNRHNKLSPAMSLLVIVGHVKDGIELAREHHLPRSLVGYIETHHGTTLVEYFFDRARQQAEEGDGDEPLPAEVEYRYPGPKPRTKEQAILMICDAVESATRAMPDPTPARIQSLVNHLATKRLMDGQFDECSLTLAELNKIEEAVSRTLASIYHGRVAYPGAEPGESRGSADSRAANAAS